MKRKTKLIIVIIFIGLAIIFFCNKLQKKEKVDYSFQLPKIAEDKILKKVNKTPNDKEGFLLDDLVHTGSWKEITLPIKISEWQGLEDRFDSWHVNYVNGVKVSIDKSQGVEGRYYFGTLTVSGGFLLNVYTREWGGAVYFYPNGDRTKKYKVADGYIWSFYKMNNENFALEALPFGKIPDGKILKLKKSFNKWISIERTKIGDVPFCNTFIDNNTILLVTNGKIIKLVNNDIKETLIDNAFWKGLYPNSVTYHNGYIYIGMRAGVAKINITNKKVKFFTPKDYKQYELK